MEDDGKRECGTCGQMIDAAAYKAASVMYGPSFDRLQELPELFTRALASSLAAVSDDETIGKAVILEALGLDSLAALTVAYRHYGHFGECRKD